jgi:hypothetical protein
MTKRASEMKTPATNNTIAFLMASNNEDLASDLANEITALKLELERVKEIAMRRLEVHAKRMEIVTDHDPNLARKLAELAPLSCELVTDAPKTREEAIENWKAIWADQIETQPIRDREREELDGMIAKNNEWLDAHSARMTFVGGRWIVSESKICN